MNVLVACEESQEVCKAFRALGHDAYSCDIQPCSGGHPEWHIQNIRVQAEKAVQQKQEVRLFRGLPGQWRNNGGNVLTISILNDIIDMRATV